MSKKVLPQLVSFFSHWLERYELDNCVKIAAEIQVHKISLMLGKYTAFTVSKVKIQLIFRNNINLQMNCKQIWTAVVAS